jgi:hypothetical protein
MPIQVNKTAGSGAVGNFFALTGFSVACTPSGATITLNYDLWISQQNYLAGDLSLNVTKQITTPISIELLNGLDPFTFADNVFLANAQTVDPIAKVPKDPDFVGAVIVPSPVSSLQAANLIAAPKGA